MAAPSWVKHGKLIAWVDDVARLTSPDRIVWSDGSEDEYQRLCAVMVAAGTMKKLNPLFQACHAQCVCHFKYTIIKPRLSFQD